ncbi:MAG TPA: SMP-30/gluconolactonase/LRE family protein [Polyangiaceae bacterium]|nr:SMP-30/gluconolactonase/LRE family protein [Polyangiaceae bacterium]
MRTRLVALCVSLSFVACGERGSVSPNHLPAGGATAGDSAGGSVASGGAAGAMTSGGSETGGSTQGGALSAGAGGMGGSGGSVNAGGAGGTAGAPQQSGSICPPGPYAASPLPASPTIRTVCTGMKFTEGPVWLADQGKLFFSNFDDKDAANAFPGGIMAYAPGGTCEPFLDDAGTNGLGLMNDGRILAARQVKHTVTLIDVSTKQMTDLVSDYMGMALDSPNDVTARKDGNVYFTDPTWVPRPSPQALYRRAPNGTLTALPYPNRHPNGITLSADQQRLFLSLESPNEVVVFDVAADGSLSSPQQWAADSSDGMVIDCAGNVYFSCCGSVRVYSPQGALIGTLPVPDAVLPDPTNLAFGGPDRKTLYITGSSVLRAVDLNVPGYPF